MEAPERGQGLSDEARADRGLAEREVAERAKRDEPHDDLAHPIDDPDPTEDPDPYGHAPEPHPPRNMDRLRDGEGAG